MSPKSKTQKRREQRSKNSYPASDRSGKTVGAQNAAKSNSQQKALSQLKKQFDEQAVLVRQQMTAINTLKKVVAPDSSDTKIDEKYVKVPDATETALKQLGEVLEVVSAADDSDHKTSSGKMTYKMQRVDAAKKAKELIGVITDLNAKADEKKIVPRMYHASIEARLGRRIPLKQMSIKLAITGSLTSAANTALTTPISIIPGSSSEFGNCAGLFDEYICDGVEFHFRAYTDGATANIAVCNGIVVYDPIDNTAYGSIVNAIVGNQKFGPFAITGPTSSAQAAVSRTLAPEAVTGTGFWCLHAKMPKQAQESPTVSVEIVTGHWDSTIDTGAIYGYVKPYFDASGAGNTSTIIYWMVMHCRFRSRT